MDLHLTLYAYGDEQGVLRVHAMPGETLRWSAWMHEGAITTLAWSPDGHYLASGGTDGRLHIWLAESGDLLRTYKHTTPVRVLSWSPDSLSIVSVADHTSPQLWQPFSCAGPMPA
jgi:WD40 repeat protein